MVTAGAYLVVRSHVLFEISDVALDVVLVVGLVTAGLLARIAAPPAGSTAVLAAVVILLFFPLLSSYIALQFTGSTTFTSMSGTKKELRLFLPLYVAGAAATVVLLAAIKAKEWQLL